MPTFKYYGIQCGFYPLKILQDTPTAQARRPQNPPFKPNYFIKLASFINHFYGHVCLCLYSSKCRRSNILESIALLDPLTFYRIHLRRKPAAHKIRLLSQTTLSERGK